MQKELLSVSDVQDEFGLGRDLTLEICKRLPHLYVGRRGLRILRTDIVRLLSQASREQADLWQVVKEQPVLIAQWAGVQNEE